MTHTMEILDGTGHLTLEWSPDDPTSVERARETFRSLKAQGYAFFASREPEAAKVATLSKALLSLSGALDVRQVKEFEPTAQRSVAVRPMRGG